MANVVNRNGEPPKKKTASSAPEPKPSTPHKTDGAPVALKAPVEPPPPRTPNLDVASQTVAIAPARKTPWWVWLMVASAPAVAAAVWIWLRH